MRWLDASTVHRLLPYPALCQALASAHHQAEPVQADLCLAQPSGDERFVVLPAWSDRQLIGVKLLTVFPQNAQAQPARPSVQGVYVVFDGLSGAPLFAADGAAFTARKTAADSALGLHLLARPNVERLLMIGAGDMAAPLIEAFTALRPSLRQVQLWNRSRPRAEQLAARLAGTGLTVKVVDDLDRAVAEAEVVCSATMSDTPLVRGALLAPGSHVNLVGSWQPDMREADTATFQRGQVFVDYRPTALASGDLAIPLAAGELTVAAVRADLFALCQGSPLQLSEQDISVFKNGGGAHLDLFTAQYLWQVLQQAGM